MCFVKKLYPLQWKPYFPIKVIWILLRWNERLYYFKGQLFRGKNLQTAAAVIIGNMKDDSAIDFCNSVVFWI